MFDSQYAAFTVSGFARDLAQADLSALDDVARIDLLRSLEELKCVAEGAQAEVAAAFDDSQRRTQAERGVPEARDGSPSSAP